MKTIAIIGFGFCGKMTFVNLVKNYTKKLRIIIFDDAPDNFSSSAFSDFSPHYILNVPVNNMSAFSQKPDDFSKFLEENYPQILSEIGQSGFAPRNIYSEYLQKILDQTFQDLKNHHIEYEIVKKSALAVDKVGEKLSIKDAAGNDFLVDEIVVATSFKQSAFPWSIDSEKVIKNLWHKDSVFFHQKKFTDEKICLIGSGLTTVDILVGLKQKEFAGKVTVISRRGNFPKKHFPAVNFMSFISEDDAKKGVLFLCLKIRKFLRENTEFDLRHAINSLRPITQKLWHNFDARNRKIFLRLFPYWNIFRHRAPQKSIEIIENMIAEKQLELVDGGVSQIEKRDEKILIKTKNSEIIADYVVNCLGFEMRAQKYPVLAQMIKNNLLTEDLLMARSQHKKIHLLGGLNIGRDFECTAVPDLRADVEKIIPILCSD